MANENVVDVQAEQLLRCRQYEYMFHVVYESDVKCIDKLRMDRRCFHKLCQLLTTTGGLRGTKNVMVDEMIAMFLNIVAHHIKNRIIKFDFVRSAETVSRHFHAVLKAIILCHGVLLKKPEPILENSNDQRWKMFKNCLGALDGTHIRVNVPKFDRPRYRTRKAEITTNVLGVCSQDMQFIYVLSGWEGSAHDGRVLRDAITKTNGLKVQNGCYYLVDSGYANAPGFLAPFRGQRYHLSSWANGRQPVTAQEFFNKKHAAARNVIERTFGLLKIRWKILASPSFYNIVTQRRIINACCLLHNFIRREMTEDPAENEVSSDMMEENIEDDTDIITAIDPTDEWTQFRMDQESQQRGRGANKHYWTTHEDKALIEALVDLSTNTMWRAENGFRNGYLHQLEKMIKEKFPHTTLKAVPNIESRVKLFRTKTTAIADILSISGFVWNNEHSTIECEKSAYDEYVKNHKEAAGLYGKSFPFFNDLAPVFTKDRAQGNARGDLGDDVDQYMHENISLDDNSGFSQFHMEDVFMPTHETAEPPSPRVSDSGASSSTAQKKKKRANDTNIASISENFRQFVDMVGPGFKAMAECAIRNADANALRDAAHKEVQEKKKLLNQVIFNIDGLSEDEALVVIQSLRKDEEKLNMFWDLPDDKKLRFCRLLIGGRDTI